MKLLEVGERFIMNVIEFRDGFMKERFGEIFFKFVRFSCKIRCLILFFEWYIKLFELYESL